MSDKPLTKAGRTQAIFKEMLRLAEEWQSETGGGAFFELRTAAGGRIQLATKKFKAKSIKVSS